MPRPVLPPTSPALLEPATRPYFLWWTDATIADLRRSLRDPDPQQRAYWMGALLREANTRDVWLYVTPDEIRDNWSNLIRHLGRSRPIWSLSVEHERNDVASRRSQVRNVAPMPLVFDRRVMPADRLSAARRSEPRDLVDQFFLERAGFPPGSDLDLAIRKMPKWTRACSPGC